MIRNQSLVLYKGRPALVVKTDDKLTIETEDSAQFRVREKDVELVHPGPVAKIPRINPETYRQELEMAWEMLAGAATTVEELAGIVSPASEPAVRLAVHLALENSTLFKAAENGIHVYSAEERQELEQKQNKKQSAEADRKAFLERAKKLALEPGDERFYGEVEAFALGQTSRSKTAEELGIGSDQEKAHAWLLRNKIWSSYINPYPQRARHPLKAPELPLPSPIDAGRGDFTATPSWAIDNAWSHDPDDAIGWDGEAVLIHIADPACFILPGSPLDMEASNRGSTLYLPEGSIPMLPDSFITECGLGMQSTSRTLTFRIFVKENGEIASVTMRPGMATVTRATYESACPLLADTPLKTLAEIAAARKTYREQHGAVIIDKPEVRVHLQEGHPIIDQITPTPATELVREMMILAGEAVARWAFETGLPFPFYCQDAPMERNSFPEGLAGAWARIRTMKAGYVSTSPRAHHGLGIGMYTQVTSPLRRYSDLIAHEQMRAYLAETFGYGYPKLVSEEAITEQLGRASFQVASLRKAERASDMHWTLVWLQEDRKSVV